MWSGLLLFTVSVGLAVMAFRVLPEQAAICAGLAAGGISVAVVLLAAMRSRDR